MGKCVVNWVFSNLSVHLRGYIQKAFWDNSFEIEKEKPFLQPFLTLFGTPRLLILKNFASLSLYSKLPVY